MEQIFHQVFIQASVDGHLGWFHVLAVVNKAAMNRAVKESSHSEVCIFFGEIPSSDIVRSSSISIFSFLRYFHTIFHRDYTKLHSHHPYTKVPLSPHPHRRLLFSLFDTGRSRRGDLKSRCGSHSPFPDNKWWTLFLVPVGHLTVFGEVSTLIFCPFLDGVVFRVLFNTPSDTKYLTTEHRSESPATSPSNLIGHLSLVMRLDDLLLVVLRPLPPLWRVLCLLTSVLWK